MFKNEKVKNAILIGSLCSISYLAVYIARNVLSAVSPQMISVGNITNETVGALSSTYFILYAIGQLINGAIGDKIKARYMISFGLLFAGICNIIFPYVYQSTLMSHIFYGMTGFFLSMIYGPMTKVVAENTEPVYATRCSLGYNFASFFGSPLAGLLAAFFTWEMVFSSSSIILIFMGIVCFVLFIRFEKTGIVKYNQYTFKNEENKGGIKVLIEHRIIRFTLISIITGVVRTTVVFWLPTYISQYLGFSAEKSALIFTVATLIISLNAFIGVFVYERFFNMNMDLSIFAFFLSAALSFVFVYITKIPVLNIAFMILAIMSSNCAATMLWSRYCPSLRDTGMVSGATGFLDFASYMAAAASSTIFANAVSRIGWGNLILIWAVLMVAGVMTALPLKRKY